MKASKGSGQDISKNIMKKSSSSFSEDNMPTSWLVADCVQKMKKKLTRIRFTYVSDKLAKYKLSKVLVSGGSHY